MARARCSTRADGDLQVGGDPADLSGRRRALVDLPWAWLHQVHGADVAVVAGPADVGRVAGLRADALVTAAPGVVLAVHAADCGPVALVSPEGVVGAAHAGWRGTEAGVLQATAAAMRRLGATTIEAALFPCLHVECCEFGLGDLDRLAARLGDGVRGVTAGGAPALDLPAAVGSALAEADVALGRASDACTACDPEGRFWSHRARAEPGRTALAVWIEGAEGSALPEGS
jgi:copper oxidase (laccase) domain-containing protein